MLCCERLLLHVRSKLFMMRGKKCTHAVPISKANSGPGCYCQPFISGALGSCLRSDEVWVPFLFPRQAKPSPESGIHHLWERLVFISRRHFPRRAICLGKKKGIQRMEGKCFQKLSLKRSLITVSSSYSLFLVSISLYTQYI